MSTVFLAWETTLTVTTMGLNQGEVRCAVVCLCSLPGVTALLQWQLYRIMLVWEKNKKPVEWQWCTMAKYALVFKQHLCIVICQTSLEGFNT